MQPSSAVSSPTQPGPVLYMPSAAGDSVPVSPSSPHAPDLSAVRACPGEWVGTLPAQEQAPASPLSQELEALVFVLGLKAGRWGCSFRASSDGPGQSRGEPVTAVCQIPYEAEGSLRLTVAHWPQDRPPVLFCSSSVGTVAWAAHLTSAAPHQAPAGKPQTWRAWSFPGSLALLLAATRKLLASRGRTRWEPST